MLIIAVKVIWGVACQKINKHHRGSSTASTKHQAIWTLIKSNSWMFSVRLTIASLAKDKRSTKTTNYKPETFEVSCWCLVQSLDATDLPLDITIRHLEGLVPDRRRMHAGRKLCETQVKYLNCSARTEPFAIPLDRKELCGSDGDVPPSLIEKWASSAELDHNTLPDWLPSHSTGSDY